MLQPTCNVKLTGENTDKVKSLSWVSQDCISKIYSEHIFGEALNEMDEGFLLNRMRIIILDISTT